MLKLNTWKLINGEWVKGMYDVTTIGLDNAVEVQI